MKQFSEKNVYNKNKKEVVNLNKYLVLSIVVLLFVFGAFISIKEYESDDDKVPEAKDEFGEEVFEVMDEDNVVTLVTKAMNAYWYVLSGGKHQGELITFEHNGLEYRYLGDDLNTKEKLIGYLSKYYTPEARDNFIYMYSFIEHEGMMAQPNADGGSLLEWENAQASLISETETTKSYELKVPYGEGEYRQFDTVEVIVQKIEKGWKVADIIYKNAECY